MQQAKEEHIPFYQDDKLAKTLSKLEIGEMIPPELYEVVAEILVFVDDPCCFHGISLPQIPDICRLSLSDLFLHNGCKNSGAESELRVRN